MGDSNDTQQKILVDILQDPTVEAKELPFSLLVDITANFSVQHEIGRGGFGVVYKAELPNGMTVAVKRLHLNGQIFDDNGFYAEVNSMKKLCNKNVVRLLGYCVHTETEEHMLYNGERVPVETRRERLLCFEYVPNGAVQKAGVSGGEAWPLRYQIIKVICNGLEYIHDNGYIHLDLKPDNILLDEDMVPKITDFGLSRFFGDQSTRNTINTSGTLGYMAPEYINKGTVSKKADMFSLGVVIFELLTGSRGPEVHEKTQKQKDIFLEKVLHRWNATLCQDLYRGSQLELAYQQVETCLKIALNCTDDDRDCRRTPKEISQILDLALDPYLLDPHCTEVSVFVKQCVSLQDMDLHPSQPLILLSLLSGAVEVLDYNTKEVVGSYIMSKNSVHSAKFTDGNGWNIVAGDSRGVLHVRNLEGYEQGAKLAVVKTIVATEGKGITSLAVHPSKCCLLVSTGSSIMIWNTEDWTCSRMFHGPGYFDTVKHATFNTTDDRVFGIGCGDGTAKLWSHAPFTSTRRPYLILWGHSEQVCSISYFTRDSEKFVVTGSMDKTAKVWKYSDNPTAAGFGLASITEPEATLKHTDGVTATCYSPELNMIFTGTNNGVVLVWCSRTYRRKRILCFGLGRICNLICIMGRRVFIGHEHGLVQVEVDRKLI